MSGVARTFVLTCLLTGLLLLMGFLAGYLTGIDLTYTFTFALVMAVALNVSICWYADKWVLKLYRAKLVNEAEEPELHRLVERLASNARLPKPKVAIVPTETPNAQPGALRPTQWSR